MAPMYTLALSRYGIVAAGSLTLVVSYNVMARPLTALIFAGWISGNYFVLASIVAIYLFAWVFLRLYRDQYGLI